MRILKTSRRNIGSSTCSSIQMNVASRRMPRIRAPITTGLPQTVDLLVTTRLHVLTQHRTGPDRASDTNWTTDQKDQPPIEIRQNTTQNQPNDRAENRSNLVDAQREATLVRRESIRNNRRTIGEEKTAADPLDKTKENQF